MALVRLRDFSDHDMVKVLLSFHPGVLKDAQATFLDESNFWLLDFNWADFFELNKVFNAIDLKELRNSGTFEDFLPNTLKIAKFLPSKSYWGHHYIHKCLDQW